MRLSLSKQNTDKTIEELIFTKTKLQIRRLKRKQQSKTIQRQKDKKNMSYSRMEPGTIKVKSKDKIYGQSLMIFRVKYGTKINYRYNIPP